MHRNHHIRLHGCFIRELGKCNVERFPEHRVDLHEIRRLIYRIGAVCYQRIKLIRFDSIGQTGQFLPATNLWRQLGERVRCTWFNRLADIAKHIVEHVHGRGSLVAILPTLGTGPGKDKAGPFMQ